MRLGCCGVEDRLAAIERAGYDFIEPRALMLLPDRPDREFEPVKKQFRAAGIRAEAFNVFVPSELKITGDAVDFEALANHVEIVVKRASLLGAETIVFGSGGARNVAEGYSRGKALDQIKRFAAMAAETGQRSGITMVIEPLAREYCNVINTVAEALEIAEEVDHPNLCVLADLLHMEKDEEPWDNILKAAPRLKHVHLPVLEMDILTSRGRNFSHLTYMKTLKEAGYDGRISVEDNGRRFVNFDAEVGPVKDRIVELWESIAS